MEGVRTRIAAGLAALLVLLVCAVAARAQDDDPERGKAVEEIYKDYRDDGVIEACDHSKRALKKTLDQLPDTADVETPDLRPALEAGIEQHEADDCDEAEPTPTPTPAPTAGADEHAGAGPDVDARAGHERRQHRLGHAAPARRRRRRRQRPSGRRRT